jgi:hypothetical protein
MAEANVVYARDTTPRAQPLRVLARASVAFYVYVSITCTPSSSAGSGVTGHFFSVLNMNMMFMFRLRDLARGLNMGEEFPISLEVYRRCSPFSLLRSVHYFA